MSYLRRLGLDGGNYDLHPAVPVRGFAGHCLRGWEAVGARLREAVETIRERQGRCRVAVECYSGILDEEVVPAIQRALAPGLWVEMEREVFRDPAEVEALVAPWLGGNDPLFGFLTRLELADFLDRDSLARARQRLAGGVEVAVVYGPGASLCLAEPDLLVYADLARWEAQLRQRANRVNNLGVSNREERASLQYKRSFFIDWRVCDGHKRATLERWDFLLDTCAEGDPKLLTGEAFRAGLAATVRRPFRVQPFFDPGVWGGQWMREVCGLPAGPPNYAWCFDCVPEENSLVLEYGDTRVEVPALDLVFRHPEELLGEPVYGRMGAEFPIRFDLLDTMGGQNLSFQVHPKMDFARRAFGLAYTQDESYYILDAEEGAVVFLGVKEGVEPGAMLEALQAAAADPARPFPDGQFVARFPARRHDHFLIPAGTVHCSGANSLVLEISHTPYIFTLKLWDWARVDLNGLPRPINLERGAANIDWRRDERWVRENLVNRFEPVGAGPGWTEERTGLYRSELLETRRHRFTGPVEHDTAGESVHVLNLVEGKEAVVTSPDGAFAPFTVHFAETFIVPAAVGPYRVEPGEGVAAGATVQAYVRTRG